METNVSCSKKIPHGLDAVALTMPTAISVPTRSDYTTSVEHLIRNPSAPPDPYWGQKTAELYINSVNPSSTKKSHPSNPKEISLLPLVCFECFLVDDRRSECPERNSVTYNEPYLRWQSNSDRVLDSQKIWL